MRLTSLRLTWKQHWYELTAAISLAVLLGAMAMIVSLHLASVNVPPGCIQRWLTGGPIGAGDCSGPVQAFGLINEEEAGKVFAAMAVLPFAIGLLGGVPIVGRELEARTLQTAWSLEGSRLRWLTRQVVPIALMLAAVIGFAALTSEMLQATREPWTPTTISDAALHGPLVVVRAFAALGLGLLVGAVFGRTLPAFIMGAAICFALVLVVQAAREQWLLNQRAVVTQDDNDDATGWRGTTYGSTWLDATGAQLDDAAALSLVPADTPDMDRWLTDHGYRDVPIGVSDAAGLRWRPYDAAIFIVVGAASFAGAALVVNRKRPT